MGQHTGRVYDLDFLSLAGYVQVALDEGVGAFQVSSSRLMSLLQVALKTGFDTTVWYPDSDCTSPPPALLAVKVEAGSISSVPLKPGYVTMLSFDARTSQGSTTVFNENNEAETYGVLNPLAQGILEAAMLLNLPTGYLEADDDKQIKRVKVNNATDGKASGAQDVSSNDATAATRSIAEDILAYCVLLDTSDDPVMKDCNAFLKKVGSHVGVTIPDLDADGIVGSFSTTPFSNTTMDPSVAMSWAKTGLVVAGMKTSELNPAYGAQYHNGHLAIVHAIEDPKHQGFPMASWGTLGSRGHSDCSIRQSFPAAACDDNAVHFAFAATS